MIEHPTTNTPAFGDGSLTWRPTTDQYTAKALLRLAKFIDITVTQDDHLLSELETAFGSGSLTRLSDAAANILRYAEAKTWGGA